MKFRNLGGQASASGRRKAGKIAALFAAALLCAAPLAGCGTGKAKTIDVAALADDLKNTVPFSDSLWEMNDAAFGNRYSIDESDLTAKKVYVGSGATAEEIAVFEAKDKTAEGRVRQAVDEHIQDQVDAYTNYQTQELKKLSDPVIVENGNYVILCVSDHNDTAKACIKKYTK